MKKTLLLLVLLVAVGASTMANNVQISNLTFRGPLQDVVQKTRVIRMDLSWDNSWRTNTYESNYDAVWLFAKWRKLSNPNGPWYHATLKSSNSDFTTGTTQNGTASATTTLNIPADGKGCMAYRKDVGIGSMTLKGVELTWNYGADGLNDIDSVAICVYGIEMVYIPQGSFYLGDGSTGTGSSVGQFVKGTTTNTPFQVTSEAAISVDNTSTNSLWGTSTAGNSTIGATGTLPAAFPKGYQGFYIMKYGITQGQYRDFLNKLTLAQQNNRGFGITSVPAYYANNSAPTNRNAIRLVTSPSGLPRTYDVDLNNNGVGNEANDGENLACSLLTVYDVFSYLDWAGLRPPTELEFEKACRGTLSPTAAEKAWGTTNVYPATTISNSGANNEVPNLNTNVCFGNNSNVQGPIRVGSFAAVNSTLPSGPTRELAGASYYGVMELSGNLWTFVVDVNNSRSYDGQNGDGILKTNGDNDTANWPATGGLRGGCWQSTNSNEINVSDRTNGSNFTGRYWTSGGRGVRTAF